MTLDARSITILSRLVQAELPVPIYDLMEDWEVTRNTVYRDIKRISEWLEKNRLQPIRNAWKTGFYLESLEKGAIKDKLGRIVLGLEYRRSLGERRAWIGVLLLTREEPIYLGDLMNKLNVSRSTVLRDMEELKERLVRHGLDLQLEKGLGYHIIGAEQDKRQSLVHFLARIHPLKESQWLSLEQQISGGTWTTELFASHEAAGIYRILIESEKYLGIHYPDELVKKISNDEVTLIAMHFGGWIQQPGE